MRFVVDTGVFSASLSRRRRPEFDASVAMLARSQLLLAPQAVAELRYGALVARWGGTRRDRLEEAIKASTVLPVTDATITRVARLRHACRIIGHPLGDRAHSQDLWIAAATMQSNASLLTLDTDFENVPGLRLARKAS